MPHTKNTPEFTEGAPEAKKYTFSDAEISLICRALGIAERQCQNLKKMYIENLINFGDFNIDLKSVIGTNAETKALTKLEENFWQIRYDISKGNKLTDRQQCN